MYACSDEEPRRGVVGCVLRQAFDYRGAAVDARISWARVTLPMTFAEALALHDPFQREPARLEVR